MAIALIGHALAMVVLILAALEGGVSLAVHLASATPTPTPTSLPALLRPVLPAPSTVVPLVAVAAAPPATATPEPTAAPTATDVPSPTPLPLGAVDAGGRGARLREGPGLRAAILGVLPEQALVSLLEPEANEDGRTWRRIRSAEGLEGWVDTSLLAPAGAPAPTGPPPAARSREAE